MRRTSSSKPRKRVLLVVVCGRYITGWKEQKINPTWNVLMKDVDLEEPASFLDHVFLVLHSTRYETSKDILDKYRTMFESRIFAGTTEKLPCSGKGGLQTSPHGPMM